MESKEFPPIKMRDVSGGMMSSVDDDLMPDNACRLSLGFRYHKIGQAIQRNGYAKIGGTVESSQNAQGLTHFINAAGTVNRLVAAYNGTNYSYNGAAWVNLGGAMSTAKTRYASLLDLVFRVGGGTITQSWDGSAAAFGATQLTGAPSGSLVMAYKSRLLIAGNSTFPDRVYRSSVPTVAGAITWDTTTQYIDINPADGDNLTAFARTGTLALFFKRNFIYRWNGTSTDADPVINVGTVSQETVASVNGTVFFFHPRGVFATDGGMPVEMSRPVKDFIDAIPAANYSTMCAYSDGDRFGLVCGTVVKDGRTFTNLVLEYDTSTKIWQPHVLAHAFTVFANGRDSSGADYLAGGKVTNVVTMFSGNTDDETPITFERETRQMEFDGRYSTKEVNDVAFFLAGCPGAVFECKADENEPVKLGTSQDLVTIATGAAVRGNYFTFKISGSNRTAPAVWRGAYILKMRSLGLIRKN